MRLAGILSSGTFLSIRTKRVFELVEPARCSRLRSNDVISALRIVVVKMTVAYM